MSKGLRKSAGEKALDEAIQRALSGRSVGIMKLGPMHSSIKAAIARGASQESAIAAAIVEFTEPA